MLLVALLFGKQEKWHAPGWLLLGIGAGTSILAALSGQSEYAEVAQVGHEALALHRDLGNLLPWLMGGLVLAKAHVTFSKRPMAVPSWLWCFCSLLISVLLIYVGLLGGGLVYTWGIGTP